MKKLLTVTILLLISVSMYSQEKVNLSQSSITQEVGNNLEARDGRNFIEKFTKANNIDLTKLAQEPVAMRKTAWNFSVGSKNNWWALDRRQGVSSAFYLSASTCRAVGVNCYIFVEDSIWNSGQVNQSVVDAIKNAFDSSTPANPSKGIFQTNVETFGNPPNVDNDPRIIVFILKIRDDIGTDGGYTAGYFYSGNENTSAINSNKCEMYYMDGVQKDLKVASNASTSCAILAHEFQHMIQYNYHKSNPNSTFFNEGCSMIAEVINGYGLRLQSQFTADPGRYLLNWSSTSDLADYGRAGRFILYIKEQFGVSAISKFVQANVTDVNAWDFVVFPGYGDRRFADVLADFFTANAVMDKNVNPKWGYDYTGLTPINVIGMGNPNLTNAAGSVYKLSASYYWYFSGKNLNVNINVRSVPSIKIRAVKVSGTTKTVEEITPAANYSIPEFGTSVNQVLFIVYQNDQGEFISTPESNPFPISITSSATTENTIVEVKYDDKEPVAAQLSIMAAGDSVAVGFDGYNGMKLDSVKVALRTLSSISGGVYRVSGNTTSLLGTRLAVPITATGKVWNATYPATWNNWGKVDLRSYNIDASTPYIVSFVLDGAYTATANSPNRVMITYQAETNSLTYATNGGVRRWYNFYVDRNSVQDSFVVYLIRSYISNGVTDVNEPIEILPATFSLEQNYPNPFNPNTVISFQLPKQSKVEIKIFDALGNEIRTLISEYRNAGKYNIMWGGDDRYGRKVASGIYFYKITADNFSQTKKMVLMK